MEELIGCILYWQSMLRNQRAFLNQSVIVIIEATITYLQALLALQKVEK